MSVEEVLDPVDSAAPVQPTSTDPQTAEAHPQAQVPKRAEKVERLGTKDETFSQSVCKRQKLDGHDDVSMAAETSTSTKDAAVKGVAPIKAEYRIAVSAGRQQDSASHDYDDDAAEATGKPQDDGRSKHNKKPQGGQNKARHFGSYNDEIRLCRSRIMHNELSPETCTFGDKCKLEHDLRKYLADGKREQMTSFGGKCPNYEARGRCVYGWKCRFVGSHSSEQEHADGRKELILHGIDNASSGAADNDDIETADVVNSVSSDVKTKLRRKQIKLDKGDAYMRWLDDRQANINRFYGAKDKNKPAEHRLDAEAKAEMRAGYVESPLLPSEKRRIYYGPETPILAPLTTQGNLPFRRLCVSLGAQITWSEMAMGMPLIQGERSEWALLKAHKSEITPPKYNPASALAGYDNSKDLKFGAQIAANKPWLALKATEALTSFCPSLRAIDLNCGCPIDLVFRQGAGSALLDTPGKLEKILRGMNTVSGEVPITVKIRMGTKDNDPTADKLVQRFVIGGNESRDLGEKPAGVAAITLHGRSRQQRYTRSADWSYIAECAAIVDRLQKEQDVVTDTAREADGRDLTASNNGKVYFVGNGDCYSHEDYYNAISESKVDAVMVARGALVKPWIFEEIEQRQYLDKTATERLAYVEQFVRNGLEYWGSDEVGLGTTRRYLLEWLSFSCRYVPIGLLEHLPPRLGDRPPAYRGRNELETLLASPNYKDWFKISDMFLGPANKDFNFQPKHKSNSYEIEAEG